MIRVYRHWHTLYNKSFNLLRLNMIIVEFGGHPTLNHQLLIQIWSQDDGTYYITLMKS